MDRVRYPENLVDKRNYGQGKDPKCHGIVMVKAKVVYFIV